MTDTMDKFNTASGMVQQRAQGAGYRRGMNNVFNLAAALQARGINFGAMNGLGPDGSEK